MRRLAARELRKPTSYCIARDREAEDKKDGVHDCGCCCHAGKVALPPPKMLWQITETSKAASPFFLLHVFQHRRGS